MSDTPTNSKAGRVPVGIPRPAAGGRNFGESPVPRGVSGTPKEPTRPTREAGNLAQASATTPLPKD